MIGGKIDFDRIRWILNDIDIDDNHRYNRLRHKIERKRKEAREATEGI